MLSIVCQQWLNWEWTISGGEDKYFSPSPLLATLLCLVTYVELNFNFISVKIVSLQQQSEKIAHWSFKQQLTGLHKHTTYLLCWFQL